MVNIMHLNHALRRYLKLQKQLKELERDIKQAAAVEYREKYGLVTPPRIETLLQRVQADLQPRDP